MKELPEQDVSEAPATDAASGVEYGLSRRDLMKAAALLTGGLILMLSRCKPPYEVDLELTLIPEDFKRFVLTRQSPTVATEKIIVALGSQCPDLACALWWADSQEFQFFESIEQIMNLYVVNGRGEIFWLD